MEKLNVARVILCLSLLASLAACGGGGSEGSTSQASAPVGGQQSTPPAASNPPAQQEAPAQNPAPANVAPHIVGNPGEQVTVGQAYSFTPNATDDDGDGLTFSISSKPNWATFNTSTGKLSGTPDADDVGSHEEIQISVSDGESTVSLAQFAINVVAQPSNGNVTLAWQAPTENTDGTALTNLSGYKIHYGTQSGNYTSTVTLSNASLTRYVLENLATGTYFFAITALSSTGVESDLSGEASKTI